MRIKRAYLVEFRLWRRTRRRKEPWLQTQLDLPGLPDYGPHGRPEIEALLIQSLDDPPADSTEQKASSRAFQWQRALPVAPFVLLPLLLVSPRAWLLLSLAALLASVLARIRFRRLQ